MNKPIIRVFAVLLVLFGLLAYFTTRWTVIDRAALQDNPQNKRELLAQQRIASARAISLRLAPTLSAPGKPSPSVSSEPFITSPVRLGIPYSSTGPPSGLSNPNN